MNKSNATGASTMAVFIDGCAVNRFALINLDPIRELEGTVFRLHLTPALETEYRRALDHLFVPSYVKSLLRRLIDDAILITPAIANDLPSSTDAELAELAERALVVTADVKLFWRWSHACPGLVAWPAVEAHVKSGGLLTELLRGHAARVAVAEK